MSDNKTPIKHTVYESPSLSSTDIHKIIDDAMIKRDRSVSIFIMPTSMTININPSEPDGLKRWINERDGARCPECGYCDSTYERPNYCPRCGEQLGIQG